jgi:hypothetical protein
LPSTGTGATYDTKNNKTEIEFNYLPDNFNVRVEDEGVVQIEHEINSDFSQFTNLDICEPEVQVFEQTKRKTFSEKIFLKHLKRKINFFKPVKSKSFSTFKVKKNDNTKESYKISDWSISQMRNIFKSIEKELQNQYSIKLTFQNSLKTIDCKEVWKSLLLYPLKSLLITDFSYYWKTENENDAIPLQNIASIRQYKSFNLDSILDEPLILFVLSYLKSEHQLRLFEKFSQKNISKQSFSKLNNLYHYQITNLGYILEDNHLTEIVKNKIKDY